MTAPTEMALGAMNESKSNINKTAQKPKPIKVIEIIQETEAEDLLPKINTERKSSVV